MPKELDPKDARQGRSGSRVLIVLVIGLILVGIVWLVADLYVINVSPDEPAPPGAGQSAVPDASSNEAPSPGEAKQSGTQQ